MHLRECTWHFNDKKVLHYFSSISLYFTLKLFSERFRSSSLILLFRNVSLFVRMLLPILNLEEFSITKFVCLWPKSCLKWRSTHSKVGNCELKSVCKSTACLKIKKVSEGALFTDLCIRLFFQYLKKLSFWLSFSKNPTRWLYRII